MNASLRHPLFDSIVKRGRRRPLFDGSRQSTVDLNRADLVRMLPHRDPMLLIDSVCSVSLSDATIHADRTIDPDDPVLAGHFPGAPVYPGALLVESMGQACLCLHHLLEHGRTHVEPGDRPRPVRLLKVHPAVFLSECRSGASLTILARRIENDGMCMTSVAQVIRDGRVAALAILEVYLESETC